MEDAGCAVGGFCSKYPSILHLQPCVETLGAQELSDDIGRRRLWQQHPCNPDSQTLLSQELSEDIGSAVGGFGNNVGRVTGNVWGSMRSGLGRAAAAVTVAKAEGGAESAAPPDSASQQAVDVSVPLQSSPLTCLHGQHVSSLVLSNQPKSPLPAEVRSEAACFAPHTF